MNYYNGETKEEYKIWVKNWKVVYQMLSCEIRLQKDSRPLYLWGRNPKNTAGTNASHRKWIKLGFNPHYSTSAFGKVWSLKYDATEMLAMRAEAKVTAREQWEARKLLSTL